jgi:2-oxoglutarate ferredoxin oxidoreductase subunit alpha
MPTRDLTFAIVGSGGDGVITVGDMMAQAGASEGLHVMKVEAYGPQIRGGESSCTVRLSADPIFAQGDLVQVLVVFNWADFSRFRGEIICGENAIVLYEASDDTPRDQIDLGPIEEVRWVPVPFIELAKEAAGTTLAKNIVTLGILGELFSLPKDAIERAINQKFSKKKETVLEANIKGFNAGIDYASKIEEEATGMRLQYTAGEPMLLMSGNELCAVAALHAGCRFFAGYPITPSSEVLHLLSELMPKMGGYLVQTEDELSAIGAVIGGSFSGVKSMTATSGPGLALMTEMLGLASMAEIPAVIIDVQRGGPSTGLPTKSEQSDLWQALWGSHGDAPRVVLAPADVEDCFHATVAAFNIAEEAQMPVIVLSDQFIAQRSETLSMLTLDHEVIGRQVPSAGDLREYKRYKDTKSGVSPMSWPGMGYEGRRVPDQRARARRGRFADLDAHRARADERQALPQAACGACKVQLLPALRRREGRCRNHLLGLLQGPGEGSGTKGDRAWRKGFRFRAATPLPVPISRVQRVREVGRQRRRHRALLLGAVLQIPADLSPPARSPDLRL